MLDMTTLIRNLIINYDKNYNDGDDYGRNYSNDDDDDVGIITW